MKIRIDVELLKELIDEYDGLLIDYNDGRLKEGWDAVESEPDDAVEKVRKLVEEQEELELRRQVADGLLRDKGQTP